MYGIMFMAYWEVGQGQRDGAFLEPWLLNLGLDALGPFGGEVVARGLACGLEKWEVRCDERGAGGASTEERNTLMRALTGVWG
jgi:hypothetical protein